MLLFPRTDTCKGVKTLHLPQKKREQIGSVVECLTRDQGAGGSSFTSVTALWSLSKTHPNLVLVQPRKTHPCLTERLLMGCKESNQTNTLRKQFAGYNDSIELNKSPYSSGNSAECPHGPLVPGSQNPKFCQKSLQKRTAYLTEKITTEDSISH